MSNKKKFARDIQARTKWSYQFCLRLVETVGYEEVSRAVDDASNLVTTGRVLNEQMRRAHNEQMRVIAQSKESKP